MLLRAYVWSFLLLFGIPTIVRYTMVDGSLCKDTEFGCWFVAWIYSLTFYTAASITYISIVFCDGMLKGLFG